ncbi:MAG: hypothetical protein WDN76_04975 [Alphaproteobacteria bacterium]
MAIEKFSTDLALMAEARLVLDSQRLCAPISGWSDGIILNRNRELVRRVIIDGARYPTVGNEYKVTRERVRQIVALFLRRVRTRRQAQIIRRRANPKRTTEPKV